MCGTIDTKDFYGPLNKQCVVPLIQKCEPTNREERCEPTDCSCEAGCNYMHSMSTSTTDVGS